jgi:hypothetical protein
MFLIVAVFIGVILGYVCGGRIAHLSSLHLRWWGLIVPALAIQLAIFPLIGPRPLFPYATTPLHLLSYALILAFLAINYRAFPLLAIGIGAALNLLVVTVNGGYMPSSAGALARAGDQEAVALLLEKRIYGNVILMSESTRLNALGDLFSLPRWFPHATAFSVGDFIIALGLVWLIVWGMRRREA